MSRSKRSHATFEADLNDQAAAHVAFGTPLPPLDPDVRDDGSYVPVHKQEVRDERGRRRLHGAFTGGWSAGYFNTVGSKEGWAPSTFVSSRTNRRKTNLDTVHHRPEDYMDEEDRADAAAAQDIRTTDPFAALGASGQGGRHPGGPAGLIRTPGDTMGFKLLRKMGWKDGQGIGPKVRRKAWLGVSTNIQPTAPAETHLFAPDDVDMVAFSRKADRRGLGTLREARLSQLYESSNNQTHRPGSGGFDVDEEDDDSVGGPRLSLGIPGKKQRQTQRGGFGVGILNDTGSDEDDPYEVGPRISYNRVLGGDKAKKKKKQPATTTVPANPTLRAKPVFISKSGPARGHVQAKCLDGKPPLQGFVVGHISESRLSRQSASHYPPPAIPPGWASVKRRLDGNQRTGYTSAADAARAAQHNPMTRAAVLGESTLPGKSIFDYMSAASRERLAAASGRTNLPPAKGEVPPEYAIPSEQRLQDRLQSMPSLAKETAIAAMSRGAGAGGPYASDEAKRARYRLYLQRAAGFGGSSLVKPPGMTDDDYINEMEEFYGCAQLFKPMTGFMATRFTTASAESKGPADSESSSDSSVQQNFRPPKAADPAEEAAKMGMYGRMTRLTEDFFPTRLLCKRFNVRPSVHVQPDSAPGASSETRGFLNALPAGVDAVKQPPYSKIDTNSMGNSSGPEVAKVLLKPADDVLKSGDKLAVEALRPSDEVFKAIFGSSSDED
ncbi:G-patch domain-containing protein 1 [Colletotrichum tofieldiae]|nr:G patch domain-containing protein 1 [Colletotrichum tofieldiae]GKT70943.1 G-patch domain-containing protein 1 [Colletotrichum tofieldiae]